MNNFSLFTAYFVKVRSKFYFKYKLGKLAALV